MLETLKRIANTLQGTNIFPTKALLKMIVLLPRWGFPKIGVYIPKMDGEDNGKPLLKWMNWGETHHSRKPLRLYYVLFHCFFIYCFVLYCSVLYLIIWYHIILSNQITWYLYYSSCYGRPVEGSTVSILVHILCFERARVSHGRKKPGKTRRNHPWVIRVLLSIGILFSWFANNSQKNLIGFSSPTYT